MQTPPILFWNKLFHTYKNHFSRNSTEVDNQPGAWYLQQKDALLLFFGRALADHEMTFQLPSAEFISWKKKTRGGTQRIVDFLVKKD